MAATTMAFSIGVKLSLCSERLCSIGYSAILIEVNFHPKYGKAAQWFDLAQRMGLSQAHCRLK
jgi:hypothetical protein